jgi:hypothetical protein
MPFPDPAHLTTLTFDCYGTLIDWETGAIASMRPLLRRHGIALPDEQIITESRYRRGALRTALQTLSGCARRCGRGIRTALRLSRGQRTARYWNPRLLLGYPSPIRCTRCELWEAARHQQVEQDRASPLLIHHQQLAGKAADQPSGDRAAHRCDNYQSRSQDPLPARPHDLPCRYITDDELAAVNITRHEFHGEWNYTISPKARALQR